MKAKYNHQISSFSKSNLYLDRQDVKKIDQLPVSVLKPNGPLFFGSVESLINTYKNAPKHETLIIDMDSVTMIDLSGAYALEDLIKSVNERGIKVFVSHAKLDIEGVLKKVNFINNIGKENYKSSKDLIAIVLNN